MKTLILDNYDSFTYNLFQYVAELGGNPVVQKNDEISLREIDRLRPTHLIISPGPRTPTQRRYFGICAATIEKYIGKIPLLGVCLGHQGIVHVLGGKIVKAPYPSHGKTSWIRVLEKNNAPKLRAPSLFRTLPRRMKVMRYHSLMGERASMPRELIITAETTQDRLIMAFQHEKYPAWGIQFHPESIETPQGKKIINNFLKFQ